MNKGVALFKIIVWSFVALLFTGIILTISSGTFDDFVFHLGDNKEDGKVIREKSFDANEIDNLNIKWFSDSVYVSSYDGDKILITEKSNRDLNEDDLLKFTESNGTLTISQDRHINFFSIFNIKWITREIKIPNKLYKQITIDFTSGKLEMNDVNTNIFNVKMTSGRSNISNVNADKLLVDITAGSADLDGRFNDIKVNETSGSVNIDSDEAPSKMSVTVTSGSANIAIPDNDGFILGKQRTAGSISSEFRLDDFGKYKDGSREYHFRVTSGSINLSKK